MWKSNFFFKNRPLLITFLMSILGGKQRLEFFFKSFLFITFFNISFTRKRTIFCDNMWNIYYFGKNRISLITLNVNFIRKNTIIHILINTYQLYAEKVDNFDVKNIFFLNYVLLISALISTSRGKKIFVVNVKKISFLKKRSMLLTLIFTHNLNINFTWKRTIFCNHMWNSNIFLKIVLCL